MNSIKPEPENTLWNFVVESGSDVRARNEAKLTFFNRRRVALLAHLQTAYKRGPTSAPFDEDYSSRRLTRLAQWYYSRDKLKKETPANSVRRLRKLAMALNQARTLVDKAMKDDVGMDLFRALCHEAKIDPASVYPIDADGSTVLTRLADEIQRLFASLTIMEAAARRAAFDTHRVRGRPKGTALLPPEYIIALADLYRRSTGSKPGAGPGPFARFVCEFLDAVTQSDHVSATVIDAIKNAKALVPIFRGAGRSFPSPFE
jgi:hypothetical protein